MTGAPAGFKGKLNIYTCEMCKGTLVTIDRDEGVTPFLTACREPGCKDAKGRPSLAQSSMYRVSQHLFPSHEWYRPNAIERARLSPGTRDHVDNGGLILREIKTAQETG